MARRRKILRAFLWVLGIPILLVALLVAALFIRPLREQAAVRVVSRLVTSVPGSVDLGPLAWVSLGNLRVNDVVWVDEGDTLAVLDRLEVEVSLRALLRSDLHVKRAVAHGQLLHAPAILARFPADTSKAGSSPTKPMRFPRPGALAPLPSIAVDSLDVKVLRIVLPDSSTVRDAQLGLSTDLLFGHDPQLTVGRLRADNPQAGWRAGPGTLHMDLATATASGSINAYIEPHWPIHLSFNGTGDGAVDVRLDLNEEPGTDGAPGLQLRLVPHMKERPRTVDLTGVLVTPSAVDMSSIPALASRTESLPGLERMAIEFSAHMAAGDEPAIDGTVSIRPDDWIRHARVVGGWRAGTTTLDSLSLGLDGLTLDVHGTVAPETLDARGELRMTGTQWAERLLESPLSVDPIDMTLWFRASGSPELPALHARVNASATAQGTRIDTLLATVSAPSPEGPYAVDLRAKGLDSWLQLGANVTVGDNIVADLSPIWVAADTMRTVRGPRGRVTFDPVTGSLVAKGVSVKGDAGDVTADATLPATGSGRVDMTWRWPTPPPLAERLLDIKLPSWSPDGYGLEVHADVNRAGPVVVATGKARLPGPPVWRELLPEGARVDDLGPVRATYAFQLNGTAWSADLNAAAAGWIDTLFASVTGGETEVQVDSLRLASPGLTVTGSGRFGAQVLDASGAFSVVDPAILHRFVPGVVDEVNLSGTAIVSGTPTRPTGTMAASGMINLPQAQIPAIRLDGQLDEGSLSAVLDFPQGLVAEPVVLDRAHVVAQTLAVRDSALFFPLQLTSSLSGPNTALDHRAEIQVDEGWRVLTDSLRLAFLEGDLVAQHPFRVEGRADGSLRVEDLDLVGSLGELSGNLVLADTVAATLTARLVVPEVGEWVTFPDGYRPTELTANIRAHTGVGVTARVTALGLEPVEGNPWQLEAELRADTLVTTATMRLGDETVTALRGDAQLPASIDLATRRLDLRNDTLMVDVQLDAYPVPYRPGNQDLSLPQLTGNILMGGTMSRPEFSSDLAVRFPNWPSLGSHHWDVTSRLLTRAQGDSVPGIKAGFRMNDGSKEIAHGSAFLPLRWSADSTSVEIDTDAITRASLQSEPLRLAMFNQLLPPDVSLDGILTVQFDAEGPIENPILKGRLTTREAQVSLSQGSRVSADADITLGGTTKRPSARGELEVVSGVIRIPDPPKTLHPVTGDPLLWTLDGMGPVVDSTAAPRDTTKRAPFEADVNVRVRIPSGLQLYGRQMQIELGGDLSLVQAGTVPTVVGELKAQQGTINFLGHTFTTRDGRVTFYGDDELDPTLDIRLSARISRENIEIVITGTATQPKLELRSDSGLAQGDIMSLLLFGKTSDELDDGQLGLVGQRSAEVAAAYAAAELSQNLTSLGVDMVSLKSGSADEASSLVVGKYLSTRALLKYEQALKSGGAVFINLEYTLTRLLKVNTRYGSDGTSGVDFNWSREY